MLPSFFDSVLQLIVRTSTDLPPDVRAAMRSARGAEPEGTRAAQALAIIAHELAEHQYNGDHELALIAGPETELPISHEARELLRQMERGWTSFTPPTAPP